MLFKKKIQLTKIWFLKLVTQQISSATYIFFISVNKLGYLQRERKSYRCATEESDQFCNNKVAWSNPNTCMFTSTQSNVKIHMRSTEIHKCLMATANEHASSIILLVTQIK